MEKVVIISDTFNSIRRHIEEVFEEIENFLNKHINQLRLSFPLLDQIIKLVEMGLAGYEVIRQESRFCQNNHFNYLGNFVRLEEKI